MFLTARDALPDRLSGFAAGGDDYLTKPFAFAELVARLRALLRRNAVPGAGDGRLRVDPLDHAAQFGGESVPLTPTEYRLLALLAARCGEVVRRAELVQCRLAARRDRPRQHARRLHRPPQAQDPGDARRARTGNGARRRLSLR